MDSMVGVLTRPARGRPINYSSVNVGRIRSCLPKHPDRLWYPHRLLSTGLFGKIDHRVKLPDSEAYPVSWLIMYGAKSLLPPYTCAGCVLMELHSRLTQKPAQLAPCVQI
jgi:hypothetical protein